MYHLLRKYISDRFSITDESVDFICSHFEMILVKKNQLLLDFDEVCKTYYFVNKGCLRIYTLSSEGNETTRFFAFSGKFGTALPSFIEQNPAREYLRATEKSELLCISRADFYKLVDTIPQFAGVYLGILELGFITAQKRIYGFQGFTAMEKVTWLISDQPDFFRLVSNKLAASYLGMSASTLSRIKAKLCFQYVAPDQSF